MKTKLIMLISMIISLSAFAQGHKTVSDSSSSEFRINTVFGCNHGHPRIPLGYFFELNGGYTRFSDKNVFLPGISMGIILDHHWSIGMAGSFIGNPHGLHFHNVYYDSAGNEEKGAHLMGAYGGLLLEYTLLPQSRVHVSFPLLIGMGYMYWYNSDYEGSSGTFPFNHTSHNISSDNFFVIEPGVKLEFNLAKILRLGLAVSYRYTPDLDLQSVSPYLINQFTARLSLRLGKF